MMRHDDETNGQYLDRHKEPRGDGTTDTTMDTARRELVEAAAELEHLAGTLQERTELVERLEVLVNALLDLLPVPVVVVDAQERLTAVSRGAAKARPELAAALGKPASAHLGPRLVEEVAAFAAAAAVELGRPGPSQLSARASTAGDAPPRFTALPGGSTLVVLEP